MWKYPYTEDCFYFDSIKSRMGQILRSGKHERPYAILHTQVSKNSFQRNVDSRWEQSNIIAWVYDLSQSFHSLAKHACWHGNTLELFFVVFLFNKNCCCILSMWQIKNQDMHPQLSGCGFFSLSNHKWKKWLLNLQPASWQRQNWTWEEKTTGWNKK